MFPLKHYDALAFGEINDAPFRLTGDGTFHMAYGRVVGLYDIEDLPPSIDSLVFNAVLITGYPSICLTSNEMANPFLYGDYSYHRQVEFETGDRIVYDAKCEVDVQADTLHSTFSLRGTMPKVALEACLPLVETWKPNANGTIEGEFSIRWQRSDGGLLEARATTVYAPPTGAPRLTKACRRDINIRNERPSRARLAVDQISALTTS